MFCNKCGANLPDDSLFCLSCGTRLEFQNEKQEIPKEEEPKTDSWTCQNCNTVNGSERKSCKYCGAVNRMILAMQAAPMQTAPMQAAPMQTTPMQATPMQTTPMQATPMQTAPMQATPMQATPMQTAPMQFTPMQSTPMQTTPMQTAPKQPIMAQITPMQVAPIQEAPIQEAPMQEAPVVSPEPDDIPTTILSEEELDRIADVIKNDSDVVTEEAATAEETVPVEETAPVDEAEPVHNISAKSELEKIEILKKYKELLNMDAITEEEFNQKKKALLA